MMSETDNYPDLEQEMAMADQIAQEEGQIPSDDTEKVSETELNNEEVLDESEVVSENITSEESLPVNESESVEEENTPKIDPATQAYIAELLNEINTLKTQLDREVEQSKAVQLQYTRLNADFDNFRRRTSKEKEDLETVVKKKTIVELLNVVDNFERARSQIKPANDGEMIIHKSYQGVYKTFVDSLKKIGVSAMRPEGEPFDPNYHEAMLREPSKEYEEGIVIEQLVRGYLLNNEVLRYAMVKVAAPYEGDDEPSENDDNSEENT